MFCNLNAELSRKNISVQEFAERIGVCRKTINNRLSGKTEFTLSEIQKIAEMFPDCTIDYLFAKGG